MGIPDGLQAVSDRGETPEFLVEGAATESPHALRTACELWQMYEDKPLALAGLSHGRAEHPPAPTDEARLTNQLVANWRLLRARLGSPVRSSSPAAAFIAGTDPRAAALLLVERLDRFDPDRVVFNWTKKWRRNPRLLTFSDWGNIRDSALTAIGREYDLRPSFESLSTTLAPLATRLGLWDFRNAFRNLSSLNLLDRPPEDVAEKVVAANDNGLASALIAPIENCLTREGIQPLSIAWEWHSFASIVKRGSSDRRFAIAEENLWQFGFVTVSLKTSEECYRALMVLHAGVRAYQTSVSDTIAQPTPSGYRAIHTFLTVDRDKLTSPNQPSVMHANVRLCPIAPSETTPWVTAMRHLRSDDYHRDAVSVQTPMGKMIRLTPGATVYDFVRYVHSDFFGFVDFAIINGELTHDLERTLRNGDVIELKRGKQFRWPPSSWLKSLSPEKRNRVKVALRPQLLDLALNFFYVRYLGFAKGIVADQEESLSTMSLLDVVGERFLRQRKEVVHRDLLERSDKNRARPVFAHYWLFQLIAHHKEELDLSWFGQSDFDAQRTFEELADAVKGELEKWSVLERLIPEDSRRKAKRILSCPRCRLGSNDEYVFELEDDTIVLHRKNSECSGERAEEVRTREELLRAAYFTIEATDRRALVFDVLRVFHDRDIRIGEVIAHRLAGGRAVIRICAFNPTTLQIKQLVSTLRHVRQVHQVVSPMQPALGILEVTLPPRLQYIEEYADSGTPFVCGGVVHDDDHFYGRVDELKKLFTSMTSSRSEERVVGATVFVNGPLKVGKTSLALRFMRQIRAPVERTDQMPALTVFLRAARDQSVEEVERTILQEISNQWGHCLATVGLKQVSPPQSLEDLAQVFRSLKTRRPPFFLLVLDEAMELFLNASRKSESGDDRELTALSRLNTLFANTPGFMLIWVGPSSPLRRLDSQLANILQSSLFIRLKGLSLGEACDLIQARKLSWKDNLVVDEDLSQNVYNLTNGNPFWINLLGDEMVDLARARTRGAQLSLTREDLMKATNKLLHEDHLFAHCFLGRGSHQGGSETNNVLEPFIRELGNSDTPRVREEELIGWPESSRTEQAHTRWLLGQLVDAGGLVQIEDGYEIAAPILGKWLHAQERLPNGEARL